MKISPPPPEDHSGNDKKILPTNLNSYYSLLNLLTDKFLNALVSNS